MTLDEMLLQKLADWRPDSSTTLVVDHTETGWKASLTADAVDTLGCRLREVILTRTSPLASASSLADQAGSLASRVTGLLEPLRVVEVDAEHQQAQLRSQAPAQRGGARQYYEVVRAGDGTTSLRRYQSGASPSGKREAIAFTLTHEALAKVVSDLASV